MLGRRFGRDYPKSTVDQIQIREMQSGQVCQNSVRMPDLKSYRAGQDECAAEHRLVLLQGGLAGWLDVWSRISHVMLKALEGSSHYGKSPRQRMSRIVESSGKEKKAGKLAGWGQRWGWSRNVDSRRLKLLFDAMRMGKPEATLHPYFQRRNRVQQCASGTMRLEPTTVTREHTLPMLQ